MYKTAICIKKPSCCSTIWGLKRMCKESDTTAHSLTKYIQAFTHSYMQTFLHIHSHTRMCHTHPYPHICSHNHLCICTCSHSHMRTHTILHALHLHTQMCHIHTHTFRCANIGTHSSYFHTLPYAHIYTFTHTHICPPHKCLHEELEAK